MGACCGMVHGVVGVQGLVLVQGVGMGTWCGMVHGVVRVHGGEWLYCVLWVSGVMGAWCGMGIHMYIHIYIT